MAYHSATLAIRGTRDSWIIKLWCTDRSKSRCCFVCGFDANDKANSRAVTIDASSKLSSQNKWVKRMNLNRPVYVRWRKIKRNGEKINYSPRIAVQRIHPNLRNRSRRKNSRELEIAFRRPGWMRFVISIFSFGILPHLFFRRLL